MDVITEGFEPLDEPLELSVIFYLPRPKTATRNFPAVMPDLDKLIRAVGDSLSGLVYVDDSRIVSINAHKRYADDRGPGALIRVNTLTDA
jgi:crossover junction endodeoxyribonuclease RusA